MICGAPAGAGVAAAPTAAADAVAGPEPNTSAVGTRDSGGAFASTPGPPIFLSALPGMPMMPPDGNGDPAVGGCDAWRGVWGGTGSPRSPPIIAALESPAPVGNGAGIALGPGKFGVPTVAAAAIEFAIVVLMLKPAAFVAVAGGGTLALFALMSPMLGCLAMAGMGSPLTPMAPGMPFIPGIPISGPCCCCPLESTGGPIMAFT